MCIYKLWIFITTIDKISSSINFKRTVHTIENPKHEIRISKQIRNFKFK